MPTPTKKPLVHYRLDEQTAKVLLDGLIAATNYYHDAYDLYESTQPEHAAEMADHIHELRALRDNLLIQQFPNEPEKRPGVSTPAERAVWQTKQREFWAPILKAVGTSRLMEYRIGCYRTSGGCTDRDPWSIGYNIYTRLPGPALRYCPLALIKEELATREHIPNKHERRNTRRAQATAGRQRGRRDR